MTTLSRALLVGLALAALPAGDAAAAAKPKMPMLETFSVTVRGSEVTTWSLRETDDPDDPCDVASSGDGSQMVRFFSKPKRITVMRDGAGAIVGETISAPLTVEREGELRAVSGSTADCPAVAEGDGGGELVPLVAPCGKKTGKVDLRLEFGEAKADDDFLVPLVAKNTLAVYGDFGQTVSFPDCPWWEGGPSEGPSDSAISTAARTFTIKNLFSSRRKVLRSSADLTRNFTAPGFTGKTLLTWNVVLKRVR